MPKKNATRKKKLAKAEKLVWEALCKMERASAALYGEEKEQQKVRRKLEGMRKLVRALRHEWWQEL